GGSGGAATALCAKAYRSATRAAERPTAADTKGESFPERSPVVGGEDDGRQSPARCLRSAAFSALLPAARPEPTHGPRERVLGLVVLADRADVVFPRARLVLFGQDVLEHYSHLEFLTPAGELQALLRRGERVLGGLELRLLRDRTRVRLDHLSRDRVL